MKKQAIFLVLFLISFFVKAQSDYKVVFDLTSKDTMDQRLVIRWIKEVISNAPEAQVEVVLYAMGTNLVVKDRSPYEKTVTQLATNKNVSFKICNIAMKNQNIDKSQLLPGIQIVPDGIYEIVSKQHQGWGYIKATH